MCGGDLRRYPLAEQLRKHEDTVIAASRTACLLCTCLPTTVTACTPWDRGPAALPTCSHGGRDGAVRGRRVPLDHVHANPEP
jgi:hypothetical protein